MPIQFRCPACDRLLGIAKRKAGSTVTCPRCGAAVRVPAMAGVAVESAGPVGAAAVPVIAPLPVGGNGARTVADSRRSAPPTPPLENLPLFERPDFESLLNPAVAKAKTPPPEPSLLPPRQTQPPAAAPPTPPPRRAEPQPTPEEPAEVEVIAGLVLSRRSLTLLAVAVAVLIGLAFAAGYFLAAVTVVPKKPATGVTTRVISPA